MSSAGPAGKLALGVSALLEVIEGKELHDQVMDRAKQPDPGNPSRQVNEFIRDNAGPILSGAQILDDLNNAASFEEFAAKLAKDKALAEGGKAVSQGLDQLQQVGIGGRIKEIDAELKGLDPNGNVDDLVRQNDLLQERFALKFGGQAFDLAKVGGAGREQALNGAVGTVAAEVKRLQGLSAEIDKRLKDPAAAADPALLGLRDKVQNDLKMMNALAGAGQQAKAGRPYAEFAIAGMVIVAGVIENEREKGSLKRDDDLLAENLGGRKEGYTPHHIIPVAEAQQFSVMEDAAKLGYNINNANNGINLPNTSELAQEMNLPYHPPQGNHAATYTDPVHERLLDLQTRRDSGEVTDETLLNEVRKLEDGIESDLLSGALRLNSRYNWYKPETLPESN